MNIEELNLYFKEHNYSSYERENYDKFLKHMNFSFSTKSIHITGTNGKGSTANFIYNMYLAGGYKVGLYNSPYLVDVTEMIKANGHDITSDEYIGLFNEFKNEFESYQLSSFEMQTYIAFVYLIRQNLDVAIIEVGMGGFIDATNIFTPNLSIITNVSLEHTAYLGRSVSEIASNKAGIIKEGVPVLVGHLEESAAFAIRQYAKEMDAPVIYVDDYHDEAIVDGHIRFDYRPYKNLVINTKAMYQCQNAALAIEAIKALLDVLPLSEDAVKKGIAGGLLPCRFEYLNDRLIVDGAHNPEGIQNLVNTLNKFEDRPVHVIFASFKDKNIETMLITLGNMAKDILLTTFDHPRARSEEDYFLYLGDYNFEADYMKAINDGLVNNPDDVTLVTGSLAFAGVVRDKYRK